MMMADADITYYIGLMAGSIFFIDGWGPSEKDKGFLESRRFRGLSIIVTGGIIAPVLDYVTKAEKPLYFLCYLKGAVTGWLFVFLLALLIYLFWKIAKDKNKNGVFYKTGEFAYSVLDFIYLGVSENPHLDAKRKHDLDEYSIKSEDELNKLRESLKQITSPDMISENSEELAEFNKQLKSSKTESEYTFEDWYLKGLAAYDRQEYEKTIAYMKNALDKDIKHPDAPNAYIYIGLGYDDLGLIEKGVEQFDKVINFFPGYASMDIAHYNKGTLLDSISRHEEALVEFEKSIQINGKNSNVWNNKALALYNLNRIDDALVATGKAIELDEKSPFPWYNKALLYSKLNDKTNMLASLKKAIELRMENRAFAKKDERFKNFWNDEDFKALVKE